jgi:uncharacterized protein YecT (DUF1311 family)
MTINNMIACFCISTATFAPSAAQAQSQHEMNAQAFNEFKAADAELNKAYKKLVSKIDAESKTKLSISQKAWIKFRDAEAELIADFNARGGSMAPMIYHAEKALLTVDRTKQLLKMLKQYSE